MARTDATLRVDVSRDVTRGAFEALVGDRLGELLDSLVSAAHEHQDARGRAGHEDVRPMSPDPLEDARLQHACELAQIRLEREADASGGAVAEARARIESYVEGLLAGFLIAHP